MNILGISAFYHDSAAAIVSDGVIKAAAQEERFNRKKHYSGFPQDAITYCLKEAKLSVDDLDAIAFYDKPFLKFERLLETYLAFAPRGFKSFQMALPLWIKDKLFQKRDIVSQLERLAPTHSLEPKLRFVEHHHSHAASAFFPSPFERAVVLTLDGVGEWATTSTSLGDKNTLEIFKEIHFPHSLGLLYSAFTYYTGFKVNSGEYKLMGLAPYGEPVYVQTILDNLIDLKPDGSYRLNMRYFDYCTGLKMTNENFNELFGGSPRNPESESISQREMNLAASIQKVTEEVVLKLTRSLARETGEENLCLAGGVALNCVANGKIIEHKSFKNVWIQPAAGDAGGALGAALATYYQHFNQPRKLKNKNDNMKGSYLGPNFSERKIEAYLNSIGATYEKLDEKELLRKVVIDLQNKKAIGWFQGRMEYGPRALGNRSIIADPQCEEMQKLLNLKVKFRESFRPFAPAILEEHLNEWFSLSSKSPYMLLVGKVNQDRLLNLSEAENKINGLDRLQLKRSHIPAVTHVDNSARIQTISSATNPKFYSLLKKFYESTGCPILVNTSFNIRGEPIVCSPSDAYRCFMGTRIETLVMGNYYIEKARQPEHNKIDYRNDVALD